MKKHVLLLIPTLLILSACGGAPTSGTAVVEGDETSVIIAPPTVEGISQEDGESQSATVEQLRNEYGTENVFVDLMVPIEYLIITDKQIIKYTVAGDASTTQIISLDEIAKTDFADSVVCVVMTVHDKSGGTFTFNLSKESAEVVKKLMGNT